MSKAQITSIPYTRKIYYAAYADLPVGGIRISDLGYATDRLILYRWSGAAWQAITIHSSSGLATNIPTAADLPNGSFYYETDTQITKQVQAGAWVSIITPPPKVLTIAETEVFNGNSPAAAAWTELDLSAVVGSNPALVLLKHNCTAASKHTGFRKKGDTGEFFSTVQAKVGGCAMTGECVTALYHGIWVATDENGVIEWKTDGLSAATIIKVVAYIK